MSETLVAKVRQIAVEASVATAWAQWAALGFYAERIDSRAHEALIDPEALLVLTLDTVQHEARLDQALAWWAARGASLISLPRLDHVLRVGDVDLTHEVAALGARIWGAGNASSSWKRRAREAGLEAERLERNRLKGRARPSVLRPASALLRMRSIAGVGTKADLIAYLAARGAQPSSYSLMQKALGYSRSSLFDASEDLGLAGVATAQVPTPIRYVFRPGVIDLGEVPPWRFWPQIVAFLMGAMRWGDGLRETTPFLLGDQARTLYKRLMAFYGEHPFSPAYPVADPALHPGADYIEPFAETVESVARWLADGLPA